MKKNGFVFVESIVVLMVVALSVTMLMSSYSLIARKTKEKENYDKASDKYLLYAIANLGTDNKCNYGLDCDGMVTEFEANKQNCNTTKIGHILYDCEKVFDDMNIKYIYVIRNIRNTLNDYKRNSLGQALDSSDNVIDRVNNNNKPVKITNRSEKAVSKYDNGAIEYMKTLNKCNDQNEYDENGKFINKNKETDVCYDGKMYMVGVFERGNEYYYTAIDISGNVKYEENIREVKNGWLAVDGKWHYYNNNAESKGLKRLPIGDNINSDKYYFYFNGSGEMQTGWIKVFGDNKYYLFSPLTRLDLGRPDGIKIYSKSAERLEVNVDGTTYYLDSEGVCYQTATGNDLCSITNTNVTSITMDFSNYACSGSECN